MEFTIQETPREIRWLHIQPDNFNPSRSWDERDFERWAKGDFAGFDLTNTEVMQLIRCFGHVAMELVGRLKEEHAVREAAWEAPEPWDEG